MTELSFCCVTAAAGCGVGSGLALCVSPSGEKGMVDCSCLGGGVLGGGRLRRHDRCVMRRMHMAHNRREFGEPPEHATGRSDNDQSTGRGCS